MESWTKASRRAGAAGGQEPHLPGLCLPAPFPRDRSLPAFRGTGPIRRLQNRDNCPAKLRQSCGMLCLKPMRMPRRRPKNPRRVVANRHSTLLLQTVLIVLPILVLSSVALYSLRKDRALIETETRERARTNAPAIARQWGRRLSVALAAFLAEQDPRVSINKNEPAQI